MTARAVQSERRTSKAYNASAGGETVPRSEPPRTAWERSTCSTHSETPLPPVTHPQKLATIGTMLLHQPHVLSSLLVAVAVMGESTRRFWGSTFQDDYIVFFGLFSFNKTKQKTIARFPLCVDLNWTGYYSHHQLISVLANFY